MNVELIAYSSPMPYQCGTACYFNTVSQRSWAVSPNKTTCWNH